MRTLWENRTFRSLPITEQVYYHQVGHEYTRWGQYSSLGPKTANLPHSQAGYIFEIYRTITWVTGVAVQYEQQVESIYIPTKHTNNTKTIRQTFITDPNRHQQCGKWMRHMMLNPRLRRSPNFFLPYSSKSQSESMAPFYL